MIPRPIQRGQALKQRAAHHAAPPVGELLPQVNHLNEWSRGTSGQREATPALNLGARQRFNCWSGAQQQGCSTGKACQLARRITRMQSRCAIRFVGTLMLFVYNDESDLITQSSERNAGANH